MGLLIHLDRKSGRALFGQIFEQVAELIRSGALEPGERLPATRALAQSLGVNRSTVMRAYEELWVAGYLESRPGSYTLVRRRMELAGGRSGPVRGLIPWEERTAAGAGEVLAAAAREAALLAGAERSGIINFVPLSPDSRLFPLDDFRRCMGQVLAEQGQSLLQYGDPLGYAPLRKLIARRMNLHGVSLAASEVMVTAGAQGGLDIVLKLLLEPGAGVVVESPSYTRALDAFRLARARLIPLPMTGEGMDLEALEKTLAGEPVALIHTMPNFHNPSGATTSQEHRERLLMLCQNHRVPLLEDGFEEEMKYFGKTAPPVKAMDRQGVVIYLGTFSKTLFPGLRTGWIAADRGLIERLAPIQRSLLLCGNQVDQAALELFCRQGYYDRHLRRIHRVYRRRMKAALAALETHLDPARLGWTLPSGGYTIWLQAREAATGQGIDEPGLAAHLLAHGVAVLPGGPHYLGPPEGLRFRLSIAHLEEADIEEGIRRLGRAFRALSGKDR